MKVTKAKLSAIVDDYVKAIAGSDSRRIMYLHADKAGISLKDRGGGTDRTEAYKIFRAAEDQRKLDYLLDVIQQDGIEIALADAEEHDRAGDDFDDSIYRNWLESETNLVDIRGIAEGRVEGAIAFPIMELYTELYVQKGPTNFDLDQGRIRGQKRTSLTEMVDAVRCLNIMGDPGSGKTTFLRFVARKQAPDRSKPLPIYLRLADVYEFAKTHLRVSDSEPLDPSIFIDFCLNISDREGLKLTRGGLEKLCREGRCTWLMDSVDELPSDSARKAMVEVVDKAVRRWEKCKFVLTSRPISLKGATIPIGFDVVAIDNWGGEEIKSFLRAWTSLLYSSASEEMRRRHWGTLLSTIMERIELRNLAKNAVMLTAMAVVHYNEKRLPEGRADLLEAVIQWLVRARVRHTESPQAGSKFIEKIYRELALDMFEAEEGRINRVGRLRAAQKIAKHFGEDIETALDFLGQEETQTGVLVRRGEGDLAFWHLSFQEYLAAKEIAGKTDDIDTGWWSKLRNNLDKPEWREVLVLVPACLHRLGSERVDLFFERLGKSCSQADLLMKARRVALGGIILRDLRLTGYSIGEAPSWSQLLNDVTPLFGPEGEDIPLETRYEAAVAYGLGGEPRIRNFDETWVSLPGGTFYMGAQTTDSNAPNFDSDAAAWEGPVREICISPFEIRKYLITVEEFDAFVSDYGYSEGAVSLWTTEAWDWRREFHITAPLDWEEQRLAPTCPVTGISWFEANAYCAWLTQNDQRGIVYRLPSEAEWEYAAKHGLNAGQKFPWGTSITHGSRIEANFAWCKLRKKTPIGMFSRSTTADGIADMFGNVEEWCADSWTPDHSTYRSDGIAQIDGTVRWRVVHGGSAIRFSRLCRPTYRSRIYKDKRYHTVGLRTVRTGNPTVEVHSTNPLSGHG